MNLLENIREGLRSIAANQLRSVLTAAIIAIGITSLVGILTAIDGIQNSVTSSLDGLGANTFSIALRQEVGRVSGRVLQQGQPISYREAVTFRQRYPAGAIISVSTPVSGIAQVQFRAKKTNPNVQLIGIDDNYLTVKGYKLQAGRNVTPNDVEKSLNVAVLGSELAGRLFGPGIQPLGQVVRASGVQVRVIGILTKKGSVTGGSDDRSLLVPLNVGRAIGSGQQLTFNINASVAAGAARTDAVGEARGLMRQIRRDPLGDPDSFVIESADDLLKNSENITGYLRAGGFGIGFITLLGAAIALMNIMLVSVTERTREIGIRKSLGATPRRIREQFLFEAIVICLLGGLAGIGLGLGVGNLISGVVSQGAGGFVVPWTWMGLGIVVCLAVGLFSGLYPAIRASKLDPIEALRYE
jgi:putative ABC transport system permease protein